MTVIRFEIRGAGVARAGLKALDGKANGVEVPWVRGMEGDGQSWLDFELKL